MTGGWKRGVGVWSYEDCHTLYLMTDGYACKIGITSNLALRVKAAPGLRCARGRKARLVKTWQCGVYARHIEADVKRMFKDRRDWGYESFKIKEHEMLAAVEKLVASYAPFIERSRIRDGR